MSDASPFSSAPTSRRSLLRSGGMVAAAAGALVLPASALAAPADQAAGESVLDKWLRTKTANLGVDLSKVDGLPGKLVFGRQIFAMKKGRSVVPHGHDNMCTGFLILRGDFIGKHYDRLDDQPSHYLIKPTIDRTFKPGETSTISDHKDNVHWFKAASETGFIFNIHLVGYNPENLKTGGRIYVDPDGEKVKGGLIVAKKISSAECHKKYG